MVIVVKAVKVLELVTNITSSSNENCSVCSGVCILMMLAILYVVSALILYGALYLGPKISKIENGLMTLNIGFDLFLDISNLCTNKAIEKKDVLLAGTVVP